MQNNFCFISLANLTVHEDEKVGLENFELLKVLGTGGKQQEVLLNLREVSCSSSANPFVICM